VNQPCHQLTIDGFFINMETKVKPITIEFDAATARITGDISPNVIDHIVANLTWENKSQSYLVHQKKFDWIDPTECCYDLAYHEFPTGLLPRVASILEAFKVPFEAKCLYKRVLPDNSVELPDWAYEHQRVIVDTALKHERSVVQSPTGSGKSSAAAFFLSKFPTQRALVCVPSVNLLHNIKRPLEGILGEEVGMIGDGKSIWRRVTVGIINSLAKHCEGKYAEELALQEIMVIDECHQGASKSYQRLSSACVNTAYRLALSATAFRSDGADLVLEGVAGPKVLIVPPSVMVNLKVIHAPQAYFVRVKPQVKQYPGVQMINTSDGKQVETYPKSPNGKPDPEDVYKANIVYNDKRNRLAIKYAKQFLDANPDGGNVLLIVKLLVHGQILKDEARAQGLKDVPFIDGNVKGKERMEVLDAFRSGELKCLIASSILNEGEDLPQLELLINCAGQANKRITTQRIGRALRIDKSGTKQNAYIIDFFDEEPFYLQQHAYKRIKLMNTSYPDSAQVVDQKYAESLFLRQT
jgi:superfamily II DNA or RNA helicase